MTQKEAMKHFEDFMKSSTDKHPQYYTAVRVYINSITGEEDSANMNLVNTFVHAGWDVEFVTVFPIGRLIYNYYHLKNTPALQARKG